MCIDNELLNARAAFHLIVEHTEGLTPNLPEVLLDERYSGSVHLRYPVAHITCDGNVFRDA